MIVNEYQHLRMVENYARKTGNADLLAQVCIGLGVLRARGGRASTPLCLVGCAPVSSRCGGDVDE